MEAPKFNNTNGNNGNTGPLNSSQAESKLHFLDYWRIIRIRKTVILAVFLLVVLTTTAVTFILPESFMSTARIEVSKDTSDIPLLLQMGQQGGYDPYFIETEFQKIKSTKVLEKVISDLDLNRIWSKRFGIESLKTSESYEILKRQIDLRQSRNTSLIEINAYSENKQEACDIANKIAEVYQENRRSAKISQSQSGIDALKKEMEEQSQKVDSVQKEVDRIRNELKIADVGDSQFQMTLEPETVRNIERDRIRADEEFTSFTTLYESLNGSWKFMIDGIKDWPSFAKRLGRKADPASEFLYASLDSAAQGVLAKYQSTDSAPENSQEIMIQNLNRIVQGPLIYKAERFPQSILSPETKQLLAQNPAGEELSHLNRLLLQDGYPLELSTNHGKALSRLDLRKTIPTTYRDEAMDRYLGDLAKSEQQYAIASVDFAPQHPEVLRLLSVISNINQQIEARMDGILRGLEISVSTKKATADRLQKQVDDAKDNDAKKMQMYRPYFKLRRDLETQQRLRDNIFIRVLQETVDKSIPKSSLVEIIDRAKPAVKPVRPNIPLNISLGVVVGLIMGFGLAFFIEYLDTSVKTIDDVERTLQAPVIGVIPQNVGSLLSEGPDSPHAEAYRVLRTNMLFARKNPTDNTITVVSGGAGEGKSTTIFNLATIFAQNGHRVLLVDSDLRRPSLHKLLNVSNSMGLTNYLLKQNNMDEVIQTTPTPLLNFLPSGKLPSSSLGILNSAQMREFIQKAKERYDFVFFDSPPIMGVSDASILASEVDMALLVIQYRKYPQVMTVRAKQMVEKVGGNLLGVVLNNINISQDSYYYYYSGYYYDYYSKHDDQEKVAEAAAKKGKGDRAAVDIKQKF